MTAGSRGGGAGDDGGDGSSVTGPIRGPMPAELRPDRPRRNRLVDELRLLRGYCSSPVESTATWSVIQSEAQQEPTIPIRCHSRWRSRAAEYTQFVFTGLVHIDLVRIFHLDDDDDDYAAFPHSNQISLPCLPPANLIIRGTVGVIPPCSSFHWMWGCSSWQ